MFTSEGYINLGKDIDEIINGYLSDLNQICDCYSCISFRRLFDNFYYLI